MDLDFENDSEEEELDPRIQVSTLFTIEVIVTQFSNIDKTFFFILNELKLLCLFIFYQNLVSLHYKMYL